jgi:cyclopropane fatty-acyl-phospholipid synthase-like methyltransferase
MKVDTLKAETLLVDRIIKAPVKEHVMLLANHFGRYGAAIGKLAISRRDYVIDASCGTGYGSYLLSFRAKKVFGLDVNDSYLKSARNVFKARNLSFYTYRAFDGLRRKDKVPRAGKIVCIETFEHIPAFEVGCFVNNLLAYLKQRGDMFLTVPLGGDKPCRHNKFHLNKPSIGYLRGMFGPLFRKVAFETGAFRDSFGHDSAYCHAVLRDYKWETA